MLANAHHDPQLLLTAALVVVIAAMFLVIRSWDAR